MSGLSRYDADMSVLFEGDLIPAWTVALIAICILMSWLLIVRAFGKGRPHS